MKHFFTVSLVLLCICLMTTCSKKDDDKKDALFGTTWSQTIDDTEYWFRFIDNGDCRYVSIPIGDDPYNNLWTSYYYALDGNNIIIKTLDSSDTKSKTWVSGNFNDTSMSLSGEDQSFNLTKKIK